MAVNKRILFLAMASALCSGLAALAQASPVAPGAPKAPAPAVPAAGKPAPVAPPAAGPDAGKPAPVGPPVPGKPDNKGAGEEVKPVNPDAPDEDVPDDGEKPEVKPDKPGQSGNANEKLLPGGGKILEKPEGMTIDTWIDKRTPAIWNWYMHGVPDWFAAPLSWPALLSNRKELLEKQQFSCPVKDFSLDVVSLDGRTDVKAVETPLPLPLPYDGLYGKSIRLHFWVKGTTAGKVSSDSIRNAAMVVASKNAANDLLSETTVLIPTVGQFEWHGYHMDIPVAAGTQLFLKMVPGEKTLLLIGPLSWEEVSEKNSLDENSRQDPETGSLAANPMCDTLSFHLAAGFAGRYPYAFLKGVSKSGAPLRGQPYDLLTVAGVEAYAKDLADNKDLYQLANGFAMLPRAYYVCKQTKLMQVEEKCPAKVFEILAARQNPKTGLWGRAESPGALWATRDILKACYTDPLFGRPLATIEKKVVEVPPATDPAADPAAAKPGPPAPVPAPKPGAPAPAAAPKPGAPADPAADAAPAAPKVQTVASVKFGVAAMPAWVKDGGVAIPNAAKLIDTVIGWQGEKHLWPITVLDYPEPAIAAKMGKEWSLLTSECAMEILRLTLPSLDAASRTKAETALDRAAKALLTQALDVSGESRFAEKGEKSEVGGAWFFALYALDTSMLFDKRSHPTLAAPMIKRAGHEKGIKLAWEKPAAGTVAVRVYRVRDADLEAGKPKKPLDFDRLCGIICLDAGTSMDKVDPLVALLMLKETAAKSWNYDLVNCELSGIAGCLAKLPASMVVVKKKEDLILPAAVATDDSEFFVVAVDAFGRESSYAKPADAGVAAEEVATPK